MGQRPTVVSFAAPSGTGKTTLVTKLIAELKARGRRVGAIKSDAHRVELDKPGKDTFRMREAGAETTALVSRDQIAVFRDGPGSEIPLGEIVDVFFRDQEIVLAEGFRRHGFPTVVVSRAAVSREGWDWPVQVAAIVSDEPFDHARRFELDDVAAIADWIEALDRESGRADP